jgi:hypothetical protein
MDSKANLTAGSSSVGQMSNHQGYFHESALAFGGRANASQVESPGPRVDASLILQQGALSRARGMLIRPPTAVCINYCRLFSRQVCELISDSVWPYVWFACHAN